MNPLSNAVRQRPVRVRLQSMGAEPSKSGFRDVARQVLKRPIVCLGVHEIIGPTTCDRLLRYMKLGDA